MWDGCPPRQLETFHAKSWRRTRRARLEASLWKAAEVHGERVNGRMEGGGRRETEAASWQWGREAGGSAEKKVTEGGGKGGVGAGVLTRGGQRQRGRGDLGGSLGSGTGAGEGGGRRRGGRRDVCGWEEMRRRRGNIWDHVRDNGQADSRGLPDPKARLLSGLYQQSLTYRPTLASLCALRPSALPALSCVRPWRRAGEGRRCVGRD